MATLIDEIKCQGCDYAVYGHEQMSCCMPNWMPKKRIDFFLKTVNENCPTIGEKYKKQMKKIRNETV